MEPVTLVYAGFFPIPVQYIYFFSLCNLLKEFMLIKGSLNMVN